MNKFLYIISFIFLLQGCAGSDPVFDLTPEIEFVSIKPDRVRHGSIDSVKITFRFKDGDGDLGRLNSQDASENLWFEDMRDQLPDSISTYTYTLPNLSTEAKNPSIQGTIEVTMDAPILRKYNTAPFTFPSEEEVYFELYVRDRAGNVSNRIQTDAITIYE